MRRGAWHQFGDKSQRLVLEQLHRGCGVGVILSPRDLAYRNAVQYAQEYRDLGAHVLIDQQFYVPAFRNTRLDSYAVSEYRTRISQLRQITDTGLARLTQTLVEMHEALSADGVIAPAVPYEAGRPDIVGLNSRLFTAAKRTGDELGVPTYATVMLGRSVASSDQTLFAALSHATSLDADGWYYGFEFGQERVPSSEEEVLRWGAGGLVLACSGKPVLHAYSGPMALLSMGFGATGTGVGHFQNLWQFTRRRWQPSGGDGGGGEAPARFFSTALWGTILHPDEVDQLPREIRDEVLTHSSFSSPVASSPPGPWSRWDANKHLVHVICTTVAEIAANTNPRENAQAAMEILERAVALHGAIAATGVTLGDDTNAYQHNWLNAISRLLADRSDDFDYLRLLE